MTDETLTALVEAAKLALSVLEDSCTPRLSEKHCAAYDNAIAALETALSGLREALRRIRQRHCRA